MLPRIGDRKLAMPYHAFTRQLTRPANEPTNFNRLKMLKNFLDQQQFLNVWKSYSMQKQLQQPRSECRIFDPNIKTSLNSRTKGCRQSTPRKPQKNLVRHSQKCGTKQNNKSQKILFRRYNNQGSSAQLFTCKLNELLSQPDQSGSENGMESNGKGKSQTMLMRSQLVRINQKLDCYRIL